MRTPNLRMLKRLAAGFLLAALVFPSLASAATDQELAAGRMQLLEQLVVLLTERLNLLLAQRPMVLGAATTTVPSAPAASSTPSSSGGGRRRGGGGGGGSGNPSAPAALVLTMTGAGTSFDVQSNQTLSPESVSLAFAQDMAPLQITLAAAATAGTANIDLIRQPDMRTYLADMRGRLPDGQAFLGGFDVAFPSSEDGAELDFTATYVGNGVTRQVNLHKQNQLASALELAAGPSPSSSLLAVSSHEVSDEHEVFAIQIRNAGGAAARITEIPLRFSSDFAGEADDLIHAAVAYAPGATQGLIADDVITFGGLNLEIRPGETKTVLFAVAFEPYGGYDLGTDVAFAVDPAAIAATTVAGVSSGSASAVSGTMQHSHSYTLVSNRISVVAQSTDSRTLGTNDTIGQFAITFKVTAMDDTAYIATTTGETGVPGVEYEIFSDSSTTTLNDSSALTSSADMSGGYFVVNEGDTETFTVTVTIDPSATGAFSVGLDKVRFAETATTTGVTTFEVDENDEDFKAGPETIIGS